MDNLSQSEKDFLEFKHETTKNRILNYLETGLTFV